MGQSVHHVQGLVPILNAKDALEPYDTACPRANGDLIDIFIVTGLPISEGGPGGQPCPCAHDALALRHLTAGEFDPLVFQQALHLAGLLLFWIEKSPVPC